MWEYRFSTPKSREIDISSLSIIFAKSYKNADQNSFPQACREIYLTIEVFSGTGTMPYDIINNLKDTVKYWRQFIPEDGLSLNALLNNPKIF